MEDEGEIARLERKTDPETIRRQAGWAGLTPGMRVADIGCGSGKTTSVLFEMTAPDGAVVGLDFSAQRIAFAEKQYVQPGLSFHRRNVSEDLSDLGQFDFIWVRFFLEYHRRSASDIVRNLAKITKPGGIICLIDLDYNCLNHFDMPERLANALQGCMRRLECEADFDPHAGIKLYSFLYDLGFEEIQAAMNPHHLIYGELQETDAFNWQRKLEVAVKRSGYEFHQYPGGYEEFFAEFQNFFSNPRRFTYTPAICCRGRKPIS